MKNKNLFLPVILALVYSLPGHADDDLIVFVEPEVAKSVIEQHFSNITKNIPSDFNVKYDDSTILKMVVSEYNKMLSENGGFVSANGVTDTCLTVFDKILESEYETQESDYVARTCYNFIEDLVETEPTSSTNTSGCKYNVTMAPNKFHVRYEDKTTKHGFIRHCNNYIGWRNFNPGNLVGSDSKCARIGGMAVFENEEAGFKAMAKLLTENDLYKNGTLRQKISVYSKSDPAKYLAFLQSHGVNVDKKLSTFKENPEELDNLIKAIAQKEGWFNGKKACQETEPYVKGSDKGIEYF